MFRRIMLAITFVAALGAAGLAMPDKADAWRWGRAYYGAPGAYYYGYGRPYRAYYPRSYYAYPRVYPGGYYRGYNPRVYSGYYDPYYGGGYYYRPVPRVAFRIGF